MGVILSRKSYNLITNDKQQFKQLGDDQIASSWMIQLVGGGNHHGTAESEDEARPLVPLGNSWVDQCYCPQPTGREDRSMGQWGPNKNRPLMVTKAPPDKSWYSWSNFFGAPKIHRKCHGLTWRSDQVAPLFSWASASCPPGSFSPILGVDSWASKP